MDNESKGNGGTDLCSAVGVRYGNETRNWKGVKKSDVGPVIVTGNIDNRYFVNTIHK